MERKLLNRIKVVFAEKNKSNKWLSEQVRAFPEIGGECFESVYLGINMNADEKFIGERSKQF